MLCSFELNHKTVIHEKIESRVTDRSSFIAYANRNLLILPRFSGQVDYAAFALTMASSNSMGDIYPMLE